MIPARGVRLKNTAAPDGPGEERSRSRRVTLLSRRRRRAVRGWRPRKPSRRRRGAAMAPVMSEARRRAGGVSATNLVWSARVRRLTWGWRRLLRVRVLAGALVAAAVFMVGTGTAVGSPTTQPDIDGAPPPTALNPSAQRAALGAVARERTPSAAAAGEQRVTVGTLTFNVYPFTVQLLPPGESTLFFATAPLTPWSTRASRTPTACAWSWSAARSTTTSPRRRVTGSPTSTPTGRPATWST